MRPLPTRDANFPARHVSRRRTGLLACPTGLLGLLACPLASAAAEFLEYRVKAAFLHNFIVFTKRPGGVGAALNLCIAGRDPFGAEINWTQGKPVSKRAINLQRINPTQDLDGCQIVYIAPPAIHELRDEIARIGVNPILTIADSNSASQSGVALNMSAHNNTVSFTANLGAARKAGLVLSSKSLRLAIEVAQ